MKGIFTTKPIPSYNDLPEVRYQFPKTYLSYVQRMVGDWIVYYEPRRSSVELSSRGGRQGYFATARVIRIEQDARAAGLYYAYVDEYLEFDNLAPFSVTGKYFESALRKADGTTNRGAFGRAVRLISDEKYQLLTMDSPLTSRRKAANAQHDDSPAAEEQQTAECYQETNQKSAIKNLKMSMVLPSPAPSTGCSTAAQSPLRTITKFFSWKSPFPIS